MKVFFTPGPSQLHHTFDFHLRNALKEHLGSISHRGKEFQNIYRSTEEALRTLLNLPDDFHILSQMSVAEERKKM
ncbi:MAG: phosphoserine aminotransferase, partial [Bacteroidota bacterium]